MHSSELARLARKLLQQHGLRNWQFRVDHARQRCGSCNYQRREITVSKHFATMNSAAEVENTILHEIAHALVGPGQAHGRRWQQAARRVGARVEATSSRAAMPKPGWLLRCKNCLRVVASRHRRSINLDRYRCASCAQQNHHSEQGLLEWHPAD